MAIDPGSTVRLDGAHALKHALRFGAQVIGAWTDDPERVRRTMREVAPELLPWCDEHLTTISTAEFDARTDQAHSSRLVAHAPRPPFVLRSGPVVLLESPRHVGNLGAAIRVAAAAGAAGVLTTGVTDPWHASAVRTGAGLHWAVGVERFQTVEAAVISADHRMVVGVDPDGADVRDVELPRDALLCFGTERHGLSDAALAACDTTVRIPMRAGVSSLNLATAVSALLYGWFGLRM